LDSPSCSSFNLRNYFRNIRALHDKKTTRDGHGNNLRSVSRAPGGAEAKYAYGGVDKGECEVE
jgi:hypothetical protein